MWPSWLMDSYFCYICGLPRWAESYKHFHTMQGRSWRNFVQKVDWMWWDWASAAFGCRGVGCVWSNPVQFWLVPTSHSFLSGMSGKCFPSNGCMLKTSSYDWNNCWVTCIWLIDLSWWQRDNPRLVQTLHGFDALLSIKIYQNKRSNNVKISSSDQWQNNC